jgi:hypothetical protein
MSGIFLAEIFRSSAANAPDLQGRRVRRDFLFPSSPLEFSTAAISLFDTIDSSTVCPFFLVEVIATSD